MYMKKCPDCLHKSYSANKEGKWICPVCFSDITDVKAEVPKDE